MRLFALPTLFLLFMASPAAAAEAWRLVPEESRIQFTVTQMGSPISGVFEAFEADIRFDPEAPEATEVELRIDPASVNSRNRERDSELLGPAWFDVENHPQASFTLTDVRREGEGQYEVEGDLTIKGITRSLTIPIAVTLEDGRGRAESSFTLDRRDFNIGEGEWASDRLVGYDIEVEVELVAEPAD